MHNDLGLRAEEYDSASGGLFGSFLQAFSHVGLVNTAFNLVRRRDGAPARLAHKRGQRGWENHLRKSSLNAHASARGLRQDAGEKIAENTCF
jgi:hypothetical protein